MAKLGRPTIYNQEMAEKITSRMVTGESLRSICRDASMPAISAVLRWRVEKPDFKEQYDAARQLMLEVWSHEIVDIADDDTRDTIVDENGIAKPNSVASTRDRLRVDSRKWIMSKLSPKQYGEKLALGGQDGGPIEIKIVDPNRGT